MPLALISEYPEPMDEERLHELASRAALERQTQETLLQSYRSLFNGASAVLLTAAAAFVTFGDQFGAIIAAILSTLGVYLSSAWFRVCADRAMQCRYWETRLLRIESERETNSDLYRQFVAFRHGVDPARQEEFVRSEFLAEIGTRSSDAYYGGVARKWLNERLPGLYLLIWVAAVIVSVLRAAGCI